MTMRKLWLPLCVVGALGVACIHKRAPHLVPDPPDPNGGSGSGRGSALGSGEIVDGELVFHWKIEKHVLTSHAQLGNHDASALDGRLLEITNLGYTAPWQGTCESAARVRQGAPMSKVVEETGLGAAGREALLAFGFTDPLIEFRLSCSDDLKAPPMVVWLTDDKLFTCYQGVCYLMSHQPVGSGSGSGSGSGFGSGSGSGRGSATGATGESGITSGSAGSGGGPGVGSAGAKAPSATPPSGVNHGHSRRSRCHFCPQRQIGTRLKSTAYPGTV